MREQPHTPRYDYPPEKYPITIEALHFATGAVVWTKTVAEPPGDVSAVVYIPPLRKQLGHRVRIRVSFGDGTVQEEQIAKPKI